MAKEDKYTEHSCCLYPLGASDHPNHVQGLLAVLEYNFFYANDDFN